MISSSSSEVTLKSPVSKSSKEAESQSSEVKTNEETEKVEEEDDDEDQEEQVADLDQYNYLNGTYDAGDGYPFSIDFHKHLVTTQGFEERVYNPGILVLKNSGGSLVINIYGAEQSQRDGTMVTRHRSLLLAPMGVNIQKNWQTGDSITDNTDANYSRLAVTMSYDYGEFYEMTPAYQSFQNNDYSKVYYLKK